VVHFYKYIFDLVALSNFVKIELKICEGNRVVLVKRKEYHGKGK